MEGSDLCIVPLEVNKVEEVLWSLLISLLPDTHKHTQEEEDIHSYQAVSNNSEWYIINTTNAVI